MTSEGIRRLRIIILIAAVLIFAWAVNTLVPITIGYLVMGEKEEEKERERFPRINLSSEILGSDYSTFKAMGKSEFAYVDVPFKGSLNSWGIKETQEDGIEYYRISGGDMSFVGVKNRKIVVYVRYVGTYVRNWLSNKEFYETTPYIFGWKDVDVCGWKLNNGYMYLFVNTHLTEWYNQYALYQVQVINNEIIDFDLK